MSKEIEKIHSRRLIAMILLCVLLFGLGVGRLFQFQIVEGAGYLRDTQQSTSKTLSLSAARGEIVDRNGIPFTRNKAAFQVEFDYTFMKKSARDKSALDNEATNETIYKLITVFESMNEKWLDHLPVSMQAPYEFIAGKESDVSRLKKKLEINDYATAEDCLYWIYKNFGLKKYQENGKCTHCQKPFNECVYEEYPEEICRKIAGVRYEMLLRDFSSYTTRFTFAEDIKPQTVAWLEEQSSTFPGITIVEKAVRTYVGGDVASHIIGTVGPIYAENKEYYEEQNKLNPELQYTMSDIVGQSGIESALESELRGINGERTVKFNSKGDVIGIYESKEPIAGKTVQLTIDFNFQKELQQILANYIADFNRTNGTGKYSEAAAVVVLDAKTGGVLASVSYPSYDINEYLEDYNSVLNAPGSPLNNRALHGRYRPGSTFKPIVAAAALTEGLITPQSTIHCSGVYTYWKSNTFGCLQIGHHNADLNVTQALNHSCNVFFYDTGRRMGIETMNKYANYFGMGVDTGLEISNFKGELTVKGENWQEGNVVQAAIGQMDTAVTPLQMAIEAMTLANHGTRFETHLVKGFLSNDGEVLSTKDPVVASSFTLSPEHYKAITDGMILAGQTVRAPNQLTDLGYSVAVKTGTPQTTSKEKTNNSFVAFAPVDNPEIAISCVVEDGNNTNQLIRRILKAYEKSKLGPSAYEENPVSSDSAVSSGTSGNLLSSANTNSSSQPASSESISSGNVSSVSSDTSSSAAASYSYIPARMSPPPSRPEESSQNMSSSRTAESSE